MNAPRIWPLLVLLVGVPGHSGATVDPHLGFVFPAGGLPGSTITVTLGGQHLKDVTGVVLDTHYEAATPASYLRIYERRDINRVRRSRETLEARMAEETDRVKLQQMERALARVMEEQEMVAEQRRETRTNPMMAARRQFNPQIAERITLEITIPADAAVGDSELRVLTRHGLSNPIRFQIGQLPEVTEEEPNDVAETAQMLPSLPILVNGQVLPGDIDQFRVAAKRGQVLVFRLEARALVPFLADAVPGWIQAILKLHDATGREVAYSDDHRGDPDPVLIYEVPEDGELTVTVRDAIFRGREDFVYRLSIGELPFIERVSPLGGPAGGPAEVTLHGVNLPGRQRKVATASHGEGFALLSIRAGGLVSNMRPFQRSALPTLAELEPNDTVAQAQVIRGSAVIDGRIDRPGDPDWYRFEGRRGEPVYLEVYARRLGSPLDSRLTVFDAEGQRLATNDDAPDRRFGLLAHQADSQLEFVPPADGTYWVLLDDVQAKGGLEFDYRLTVTGARPDFELRVSPTSLRLPREGTALAQVEVIRSGGYQGPIALRLVGAPTGVSLDTVTIPAGVTAVPVTLRANRQAAHALVGLRLEGTAVTSTGEIRQFAVPAETMMQAFSYQHLVPTQLLIARIVDPNPVTVTLSLPRGGPVLRGKPGETITVNARSQPNLRVGRRTLRLLLAEPPEWLKLDTETIPIEGSARIVFTISPNASPGDVVTVVLNGEARIQRAQSDPDYDPVNRARNATPVTFPIAALAIQVTD